VEELDQIDRSILAALEAEGRISTLELAERVGLSPTPCSRRVKQLEELGIIEGYQARINPKAVGLGVSVMISVRLSRKNSNAAKQFQQAIAGKPQITECVLVTGDIDYILRVWVKDIDALREFVMQELESIPAVAESTTLVVLDTIKSSGLITALPAWRSKK
jgi:Lrp/AsnC family transcriptional regulator, leucine-responsive regulatory protein